MSRNDPPEWDKERKKGSVKNRNYTVRKQEHNAGQKRREEVLRGSERR